MLLRGERPLACCGVATEPPRLRKPPRLRNSSATNSSSLSSHASSSEVDLRCVRLLRREVSVPPSDSSQDELSGLLDSISSPVKWGMKGDHCEGRNCKELMTGERECDRAFGTESALRGSHLQSPDSL